MHADRLISFGFNVKGRGHRQWHWNWRGSGLLEQACIGSHLLSEYRQAHCQGLCDCEMWWSCLQNVHIGHPGQTNGQMRSLFDWTRTQYRLRNGLHVHRDYNQHAHPVELYTIVPIAYESTQTQAIRSKWVNTTATRTHTHMRSILLFWPLSETALNSEKTIDDTLKAVKNHIESMKRHLDSKFEQFESKIKSYKYGPSLIHVVVATRSWHSSLVFLWTWFVLQLVVITVFWSQITGHKRTVVNQCPCLESQTSKYKPASLVRLSGPNYHFRTQHTGPVCHATRGNPYSTYTCLLLFTWNWEPFVVDLINPQDEVHTEQHVSGHIRSLMDWPHRVSVQCECSDRIAIKPD